MHHRCIFRKYCDICFLLLYTVLRFVEYETILRSAGLLLLFFQRTLTTPNGTVLNGRVCLLNDTARYLHIKVSFLQSIKQTILGSYKRPLPENLCQFGIVF